MTAVLTRACEHCGEDFQPRRSDARFCSDTHRTAHGRANRTEPNRRPDNCSGTAISVRAAPAPVLTWDPPSQRRGPYQTTDPCPDCDGPLTASPRGTTRACLPCRHRATPPGVTAPYDRHEAATGRTVKSDDDRDDEALALAERASVLLVQIGQVLDDGLHPATTGRLEWYADEIKAAARAGRDTRVEKLAERLGGERIRRLHWRNSDAPNPAAITADDNDDQADEDAEVYDAELVGDEAPRSLPAPGAGHAAELAARGYTINLAAPAGMCQIIMACRHGWAAQPEPCPAGAQRVFGGARVCVVHHQALSMPLGRT
jgi:hypothetical protein